MPLNGREFQSLTLLVPGAMPATPGSVEVSYGAITMAGARDTSTSFSLDGMDMADGLVSRPAFKPSVDMIQEFKVQASTYSAEFGRSSGGHVQVTTKSGTNNIHGTLYEFSTTNSTRKTSSTLPTRRSRASSVITSAPRSEGRLFATRLSLCELRGLVLKTALTRTATVPSPEMIRGDFSR